MAKIGILTYHRNYNYGAYMQCYALSHRLAKDFPNDTIEVIDITTEKMYKNYSCSPVQYIRGNEKKPNYHLIIKRIVKVLLGSSGLKEQKTLQKAFEKDLDLLPLSHDRIVISNYTDGLEFIKDKYDVVVVGSDAVWEFITYDFPNIFFLNHDIGAIKMSYAASADRLHINLLDNVQRNYLSEALSDYEYLGIRDLATENLLCHIVPDKAVYHNCDPSILLDMSELEANKRIVEEKLKKAGIDINKRIVGVMGDKFIVKALRKEFGTSVQIVCVYYPCQEADANLMNLSPTEWAVVFSFFSVTFTRFFHGTLLSLKNMTPTITIDDWWMEDETHISKLKDIYNRLGIEGHYFTKSEFLSNDLQPTIMKKARQFMDAPDKDEIDAALKKEAETYENFREALLSVLRKNA